MLDKITIALFGLSCAVSSFFTATLIYILIIIPLTDPIVNHQFWQTSITGAFIFCVLTAICCSLILWLSRKSELLG